MNRLLSILNKEDFCKYRHHHHQQTIFFLFFSFIAAPNIRYKIASGNVGNVFGIKDSTGEIFVARSLDYETLKKVCMRN